VEGGPKVFPGGFLYARLRLRLNANVIMFATQGSTTTPAATRCAGGSAYLPPGWLALGFRL